MGYKIMFAPQAVERLATIVRFIAQDKPKVAAVFGMKLIERTEILAVFPDLGQPYRKRANVRRLWFKPYFVYYRIRPRERIVEILDYWHSARQEPDF